MESKPNIIQEFKQFVNTYTEDMVRWVPHYLDALAAVVQYLPEDFQPKRILDFGCGNGNTTEVILRQFPDAEYVLLDASPDMLAVCKQRFPTRNITYQEAFFQNAKFDEGVFDFVTASFALHHLKRAEKQAVFAKIYQWLSPNGIFSCSDLMVDRGNKSIHEPFLKEWQNHAKIQGTTAEEWTWIMEHYRTYDFPDDRNEQLEWLKQVGFQQVATPWNIGFWSNILGIRN